MVVKDMCYGSIESMRLCLRDYYYYLTGLAVSHENGRPIYLCNSFPKSGTHMLAQILQRTGQVNHWDDIISVQSLSGRMNSVRHLMWKYRSAPSGSLVRSHLMCDEKIIEILNSRRHYRYFIYRDPRDVVCSHANWVMNEPRIYLHQYYANNLKDRDSRIATSISGVILGTPLGSNISLPSVSADFARWEGWLNDRKTLSLRFEDLVGERGGGSEGRRLEVIERILAHIGVKTDGVDLRGEYGSRCMNPEESHTFRKGQKGGVGAWKSIFTDEHKDIFKEVTGDLLIRLGYEKDMNW